MINKDQWCNVLEFSRLIKPDLSNYDEDGACKLHVSYVLYIFFFHFSAFFLQLIHNYACIRLLFFCFTGPVLLDEFVEWYRVQKSSTAAEFMQTS